MKYPPEFRKFVRMMHQDIFLHTSNEFEMIDFMMIALDPTERATLKQFLTKFLASGSTELEAQELWNAMGPDKGFSDGLLWFLRETRDRL